MTAPKSSLGDEIYHENFLIFFGNKNAHFIDLVNKFPNLSFAKIRQVHGNHVAIADTEFIQEADAQITQQNLVAPLIATADCLPIMVADQITKCIAAIHAGWRGVANRIVAKTIHQMISLGSQAQYLHVWIGPHIMEESFEVEEAIAQQLIESSTYCDSKEIVKKSPNKNRALVDLQKIVGCQLREAGISEGQVEFSRINTFLNEDHHSFRRDHEEAGRNLSFITFLGGGLGRN